MDIWELLEAYRREHGLQQIEIAALLGLTQSTYHTQVSNGTKKLDPVLLHQILELVGMDLDEYVAQLKKQVPN